MTSDVASTDLYRIGYRYIRDRYVRSVSVRDVALGGLKGLSTIDGQITVAAAGTGVAVSHGQRRIATFPAPQAQDHDGWAALTVSAIHAAATASEPIAQASTDKIQQMKGYLKIVDEKLADKQKKVADQQKQVDLAQKQVDIATDELFQRKKDLEKLEMHKQEWEKEVRYWVQQKETAEHDEQGAQTHSIRKKEEEMRKKKQDL